MLRSTSFGHGPRKNDHKILAVALKFRQEKTNTSVVFVTKDVNLRVKADALGINSVDYEPSRVSIDELYTGMITMDVPSDVVDKFLLDKRLPVQQPELFANSYVTLKDQKDPEHFATARFMAGVNELVPLKTPPQGVWGIKPRNAEQACIMDALLDDELALVSLVGKAGTEKP